jgi:hypothetical protein
MDPTRDERRLLEIQHKISVLGHRDLFNLDIRRAALAKLEVGLTRRVRESLSPAPICR